MNGFDRDSADRALNEECAKGEFGAENLYWNADQGWMPLDRDSHSVVWINAGGVHFWDPLQQRWGDKPLTLEQALIALRGHLVLMSRPLTAALKRLVGRR